VMEGVRWLALTCAAQVRDVHLTPFALRRVAGAWLTGPSVKSSYELAMERLAKADPGAKTPLSAEKKARLAEIDRVYQSRLAEREIFLRQRLDQALAAQKAEDAAKIREELVQEKARLEEEREAEKEKARIK